MAEGQVERVTVAYLIGALKAVIAVISVFVVSIVVHEFGHFITAKRFGVAVPAFAVGFGPKLWKWRRGGTEYSIRLYPVGGFVQLAGEIPQDTLFRKGEAIGYELNDSGQITKLGDPGDVPEGLVGTLRNLDLMERLQMTIETPEGLQTFALVPHARLMTNARSSIPLVEKHEQVLGKPLWQRAIIILAGPFMNFLLAGMLFSAFYLHSGIPVNASTLGAIVPGSAAAGAGLLQGDKVLTVNGKPVSKWTDLVLAIRHDTSVPPEPLALRVLRNGQEQSITVTPARTSQGIPQLGVNAPLTFSPARAIRDGFTFVYTGSINGLQLYWHVISQHQFDSLSGPVGIADVIGTEAQSGMWRVVMIAGLLSLNLGLFNLFPFPALDGGRLLFMVVEMVRGKSVDPRKEGLVHLVGFALLMLFAVVITYHDVTRLF